MLIDGITLIEGSDIVNAVVDSGTSFPSNPNSGELFYRTDLSALHVYDGSSWVQVGLTSSLLNGQPGSYYLDRDNHTGVVSIAGGGTGATSAGDARTNLGLVIGTDVQAWDQDLDVIAGLSGSAGFLKKTAPNTWSIDTATYLDSANPVPDGNITESSVTQHEAALTILESQITDGSILARVAGNETVSGTWTFSNPLTVGAPLSSGHAATKQYVDSAAQGLQTKPAVEIATTANLTATYDNGSSGVGATLTATSNGAFPTIDGVTLATTTPGLNGVLVKNQSSPAQNGRYNLTQVGDGSTPWILTRCALCDEAREIPGAYVFVKQGTLYSATGWVMTVADPLTFTVGTDAVLVTQFSGAGSYVAGAGMTSTGTTFNVGTASASRIVVNADNIDLATAGTAGTYKSVTTDAYGRVTAGTNPTTLAGYGITDAPTVTGTGATGSWSINAATATTLQTARNINGVSFNGSANISVNLNNLITFNNGGAGAGSGTNYDGSIARTISYNTIGAPSTTGSGASGTWSINITGDAGTVDGYSASEASAASTLVARNSSGYIFSSYMNQSSSNSENPTISQIVVTNGTDNYFRKASLQHLANSIGGTSYTQSTTLNFSSTAAVGTAGQSGSLVAYTTGANSATMSFHRSGNYAINMGLDSDNLFRLGGWSDGASTYRFQITSAGILTLGSSNAYIDSARSLSGGYNTLTGTGTAWGSNIWGIGPSFIGTGGGTSFSTTGTYGISWLRSTHASATGNIGEGLYVYQNGNLQGGIGTAGVYSVGTIIAAAAISTSTTITAGTGATLNGSVALGSTAAANLNVTVAGNGQLRIQPGGANSGYIEFYRSNQTTREGYIGYATAGGAINYVSETAGSHSFSGSIVATGDITAFSDARLKTDIEPIHNPLAKVLKLRGVTYKRIDTDEYGMGFIAQEVKEVVSEVVKTNEDGMHSVAYGNMVGLLVEAIKELKAEVDSLKAKLADKESNA